MADSNVSLTINFDAPIVPFDPMFSLLATDADGLPKRASGTTLVPGDGTVTTAKFGQIQVPSSGGYTVERPFINRIQDKRLLTDYIAKDQWAPIRAGAPTEKMTNDQGQPSLQAALADLSSLGGCIVVPEGSFLTDPQAIVGHNDVWIRGAGNATNWITDAVSGHILDFQGTSGSISDLRFMSGVARNVSEGNACVRASWATTRFWCERLEALNHGTLLEVDGQNFENPSQANIFYEASSLRSYSPIAGSHTVIVKGGYAVRLHDLRVVGNSAGAPETWAETGILVLGSADLSIDGVSQILGCVRTLDVRPPAGQVVASLRMKGGFLGTSKKGARITAEDGGTIVSLSMDGVWCGETQDNTSFGALSLIGHHEGGIQQALLSNMEFPLSVSDGLNADEYVKGLGVMGGWADGCLGAGISIRSKGFRVMGFRSGADRFGGNAYGGWLGASCDDFIFALNDLRGNTTNFINGAGTGPSKIVYGNLGA